MAKYNMQVIDSGVGVIDRVINPVIIENFSPEKAEAGASINPMQTVLFIAAVVWAAGVLCLIIYSIISYAVIAVKVKEIGITDGMSKQKKVEKIFDYVHNLFRYADDSNIPNIDRSKWKSDWIEEAVRTINDETGDCYSYYSLSKAFFEYYDIENIGIMRSPNSTLEGTHYWSIVNIGEGSDDEWYYYDATRLAGSFGDGSNSACLITQETLNTHKTSKGATDFYLMTKQPAYLDFSSAGGINSLPAISKTKLD